MWANLFPMNVRPSPDSALSRRAKVTLLGLFLVALGLRLYPIAHGTPRNYLPDTHVVRSALGMAQDRNLVPEVDKYSSYPNLIPYLLLPIYGVEYGVGCLAGKWGDANGFANHVKQHPETVQLPARVLIAIIGALGALVAFGAARAMALRRGAWVAAWLTATGLLQLHFSVQERPWEPLVVFLLLSTWPAALYVIHERRKHLLWSGVAAALSFACHQAGAPALGVAGLAWLLVAVRSRSKIKESGKKLLVDGVLCVALFAVVGLTLGHPYLLVHAGANSGQVASMTEELASSGGALVIGGQGFHFALRFASFPRLFMALVGYDFASLALGMLGMLFAWRKRCMWPALGFLLLWGLFFLNSSNPHVRYLLPLAALLPLPAALFAERVFDRGRGATALLGIVLLFPLVQAVRLAVVLQREDQRAIAEQWLNELGPDAVVAIGRYGPLNEANRESLERLATIRTLYGREQYRLDALRDIAASGHDPDDPKIGLVGGAGVGVLRLEDLFQFDDRLGSFRITPGLALGDQNSDLWTADRVLDYFGVTHVLLCNKTPGEDFGSLLLHPQSGWLDVTTSAIGPPPLGLHGLTQIRWEPACTASRSIRSDLSPMLIEPAYDSYEARLPTELDFALTSIWKVERPGPELRLYRRDHLAVE